MKTDQTKILAFDLGAESGRAMLGTLQNKKIELDEIHRFQNGPVRAGGHLYTDILYLWQEMRTGLRKAGKQCGTEIRSVGVDTWGVDYVLLDRYNHLIDNPLHYRDHRTRGIIDKTLTIIPGLDLYCQTGNQFMEFNSLFQLAAAAELTPEQLERAESFLMLPDLFHFWLSGQKGNEFTNASTSQCYHQQQGDWSWQILDRLNIPRKIFGKVTPPSSVCGQIQPWLVEDSGLTAAKVILPATHDTSSAVTAIPVEDPDYLYISSGTWSLVGVELEQPIITPASFEKNLTNEGLPGGRTCFLQLVNGMWILQQSRLEWLRLGRKYSYDELTHLADEAGASTMLIDVTDPVFIDPGDMPSRIRAVCRQTGQPVPQSDGAVVRCILESLACQYRYLLQTYEAILQKKLKVIHIIGGGSRNTLLNRLTACYTGLPVIAGPVETTAVGNILVQAIGLGCLNDLADIRQVVRNSFETTRFQPDHNGLWNDRYGSFLHIFHK